MVPNTTKVSRPRTAIPLASRTPPGGAGISSASFRSLRRWRAGVRGSLRGGHDLDVVQRREVSLVDFCRDLIAGLERVDDLWLVGLVGHRHRRHPPVDVLVIH